MSRGAGLLLLTRPDCGLCEEFQRALDEHGVPRVEVADVDSRPDWQRRYGLKIPVLLAADGSAVCETFFDEAAVRGVLDR